MKPYRIIAWKSVHENYDTVKRMDGLSWIAFPTRHDSAGFKRLLQEPDGLALYGAYCLMVQVAAKLPKDARGWLVNRTGRALDPQDLADKTGAPAELFSKAFEVLSNPEKRILWLEEDDLPAEISADLRKREGTYGRVRKPSHDSGELPNDAERCGEIRLPDRTGTRQDTTNTDTGGSQQGQTHSAPSRNGDGLAGAIDPRVRNRTGPELRNGVRHHLEHHHWRDQIFEVKYPDILFSLVHAGAAEISQQRAAVTAVAKRMANHPERADIGGELAQILVEKKQYCERKPGDYWKLWQAKTNQIFDARCGLASPAGRQ